MRVGIYNRWLATLGGGEKLSLSIAEYISQSHSVSVITHNPVSKDLAEKRLNLDLSRVEFTIIPERSASEITPLTSEYDFFINSSFMDYFPSKAAISASLIYFPTAVYPDMVMHFRRRMKYALRRRLMVPSFIDGVFHLDAGEASLLCRTGLPVLIRLPASRKAYHCRFDIAAESATIDQLIVQLDENVLKSITLAPAHGYTSYRFYVPARRRGPFHELRIHAPGRRIRGDTSKIKLVIRNFLIEHPNYRLYRLFFERWLKNWGRNIHIVPPGVYSIIDSEDTYDAIWTISEFSQHWIRKYWNRHSEILNPPVNVEDFYSGEKKNQILSVGRFFTGSHNKKHLVMISAFNDMLESGLADWELHLAGGTTQGENHERYLIEVIEQARNYPIFIHKNIPFKDLVKLYSESAVYWHASGYGEDEDRDPVKFEHFGISTVESMASGCVPVVLGRGGQPEIVHHGKNGFLWLSNEELKSYTKKLIRNENLRKKMSETAVYDSRKYNKKSFNNKLEGLLKDIGFE